MALGSKALVVEPEHLADRIAVLVPHGDHDRVDALERALHDELHLSQHDAARARQHVQRDRRGE
ncbi:hypothetical protein [Mycolicibacterium iranicum]|uniref:Uncharacterized protein n=1 Tax=Mycolicibacterium iranicum TaxID=912594 RepID=A0A178LW46_MYCIR|nr:hypothetical protein [Mycolicibacterium iranicum]OAN38696.1 hypothetical protein A4X20_05180 [Mycolicibacterium iranicum]